MSVLSKPVVIYPQYAIDLEETLNVLGDMYKGLSNWSLIAKMIRNMQIQKRYTVLPISKIASMDRETRMDIYMSNGMKYASQGIEKVLQDNNMRPDEIDLIILNSSTALTMPSLASYLISNLGFRNDVKYMPFSQLGCVGGSYIINRAHDYVKAHNNANVLLVSVEFPSLLFYEEDDKLSSILSAGLFGDGIAVSLFSSRVTSGISIIDTSSIHLKNTEDYITYEYKADNMYFSLNKDVMHSIPNISEKIVNVIENQWQIPIDSISTFVLHSGGKKIIDNFIDYFNLNEEDVQFTRESLKMSGNTTSIVVFDVLNRFIESEKIDKKRNIMITAFGPGFSAEISYGKWVNNAGIS